MTCPRSPWHSSLKQGTNHHATHPDSGKWRSKHNFLSSHLCVIRSQINGTRCPLATANVVCFEHDDERLRDSPASSEGMLWAEDSLYKIIEQLSEGELDPNQPWTTAQHNYGAWGKFYELVKAHRFALCQVGLLLAVKMIYCTCQCSSSSTQDDSAFLCTAVRPLFSQLCMASDTSMRYMRGTMQAAHGKSKQATLGSTVISYHMLSLSSG